MTKAEAFEFLNGKQFKIENEDWENAFLTFAKRVGLVFRSEDSFHKNNYPYYISFIDDEGTFYDHQFRAHENSCVPVPVLLAMEIVEEPDPSELLKEAVGLLHSALETAYFHEEAKEREDVMMDIKNFLTKHSGRV